MIFPSEILLLVAHHLPLPNSSTLSSLSQASKTTYTLLTPVLYRDLIVTQIQLIKLLTYPSANYGLVRSLTLTSLGQEFDISDTTALRLFKPSSSSSASLSSSSSSSSATREASTSRSSLSSNSNSHQILPVFPNASILKLSGYIDFFPPGFQHLPHLLQCRRLVIDTRVYSWRISSIPPLWPGLEVIELQCRNWTSPFLVPGVHHVVHLSQLASPFRPRSCPAVRPVSHPRPSLSFDASDSFSSSTLSINGDPDDPDRHPGHVYPQDPENGSYRHSIETTFRWLVHCIANISQAESAQRKPLTTCELRINLGDEKELRWAERVVAGMLVDRGLGQGRVEVDESGQVRLRCLKFVLDP